MTKDKKTALNQLQGGLHKRRSPLASFKNPQRNSSDAVAHAAKATKPATAARASVFSESSSLSKPSAKDARDDADAEQANADKPKSKPASLFSSGFSSRPLAQAPDDGACAAAGSLSLMLVQAEAAAPQDDILALTTFRVTEQRADAVTSKPERTSSRSDGTEQQKVSGAAALPMNYGLCTKVRIAAPVGSLDALQAVSAAVELQSAMYFTGGQFSTLQQPSADAANATAADALAAAVTMFQSATMYWAHPATSLPPLALSTQGNALERVRKVSSCFYTQHIGYSMLNYHCAETTLGYRCMPYQSSACMFN
jgi:hypothetical protein